MKSPPQRVLPGVLGKIKSTYILWHHIHIILPQVHRYTLGNRIDKLFIEIIENVSTAAFLSKEEKLPYLGVAIRRLDTLKVLIMILWETRSVKDKKYIELSVHLDEVGRMLGSWYHQPVNKTLQP